MAQTIKDLLKDVLAPAKRLAVLGIGSEFRGDDAAGILIADNVDKMLLRRKKLPIKVFIGATAPENLTGEIKRYRPSHILLADSAEMRKRPGTIMYFTYDDVGEGMTFSTHKMPAKILADYFRKSLKCEVMMLGIQPKTIKFGMPVTAAVRDSAKEVAGAVIYAMTASKRRS